MSAPLTTNHAKGAGFQAAQYLYISGTATIYPANLYSKIHFGNNPKGRRKSLDRAIEIGWLEQMPNGSLKLGAAARIYFGSGETEVVEYVGQIATSRASSAYDRPALSKKYIPNVRGFRDDVPAFSERESPSFRSVPMGGRS